MKDLLEHINALILEYECVIIPDFGGFVLNRESALFKEKINPPSVTLGFNPVLKHNDGLLAQTYMESKSISYDTACKQINDTVKKINGFLAAKQPVIFPNLGTFSIDEDSNLIFKPTHKSFEHPSTFGYSSVELKRLADIERINQNQLLTNRKFGIKRSIAGIAAAAAAVLLFFFNSTPIENTATNTQRSSFLIEINSLAKAESKNIEVDLSERKQEVQLQRDHINTTKINKDKNATEQPSSPKSKNLTEREASVGYYIIVGSSLTESLANKMVTNLKNEGFYETVAISAQNRTRIAVARFENKAVAEKYLNNFRTKYPQYEDAWLLASRQR